MDVIYHRNCLDGVYSAYSFYLFSRIVTPQDFDCFTKYFQETTKQIKEKQSYQSSHDLTSILFQQGQNKCLIANSSQIKCQINQQFFHTPAKISFNAYSIFAGDYFPLKFPGNNKVLFILDTNLVNQNNIKNICERYELVILIDHHTSFINIKKNLVWMQIKKLYWIFTQKMCASQLCLKFLNKFFQFNSWFQSKYIKDLEKMIGYVGNNDMKLHQSKQSKTFILGFYYFGFQLSHFNPLLFKRIGTINLEYLMDKGKNLYKHHIDQLIRQIQRTSVGEFIMNGNLKGLKFYITDPINPAKISDIGTIMAYLSAKNEMSNLAVLTMYKGGQVRVSTRSHRKFQNPLALKTAQKFQGGGHTLAAGFTTNSNKLKSSILKQALKDKLKLKVEQIEQILFCDDQTIQLQ